MNGNDISTLSYKELQALALRYRVPGNIKKKLLVKVLQAAKGGNENEVDRLLQDLKQNRKKKVRKLKAQKLGLTSTPLHSPDYVMADDYYCPQQQPPYQWVGAEEEIVSRDDDRIPHYEEFKQFLLRRIQKEFQTYDTNNNQIQEPTIVDLRTVNASPNIETDPIDIDNYSRSNIIAVHNADSFVYQSHDHVEYQTLEDTNNNLQGSILLKKMLQAPVGANLEEIASPMLGSYRVWSVEQCQSNNVLDNSDTLTAESDNQDNEGNVENNLECYGLLNTIKGTYFLNEPTFVNNVEEIGEQISTVLSNESENSYRYSSMNNNKRENYTNWTISNVTGTVDGNCAMSHGQPSKIFQTMYYDTTGSENLSKPVQDENLNCQYHMAEMVHPYNANQHLMNSNPPVESQYYDGNIISNIQSDTSNTYYLQNFVKYNGETAGEYIQNVHSLTNVNMEQDTYPSTISQTFQTSDNHYNSGVSSEYPYVHFNQENNATLSENVEQQENCNSTARNESSIHKDTTLERVQTLNGILDPFRPKRLSSNPSDSSLENILNLYNSKRIDLSKLDQTSCVYCYIAPIVTHTPVLSNSACSQKERFVAEYRQHSFSPYWLLYNDTSCGMRMANLQMTPSEAIIGEDKILHTSSLNNNADLREPNEEIDVSISKVWTHNYTNYEMEVEKDPNMCEDINVEVTDCLFSVITTEPLISQVDSIIMSQP